MIMALGRRVPWWSAISAKLRELSMVDKFRPVHRHSLRDSILQNCILADALCRADCRVLMVGWLKISVAIVLDPDFCEFWAVRHDGCSEGAGVAREFAYGLDLGLWIGGF